MIGTIAVDLPERDPIKVGIGISGSSGSSRESSLYCSGNDLVLSRSSNDGWNDGIDRVTRAYPSRSNESADKHSKMHSGSRCHTIPSNVRTAWTPFKFPTPPFCKFLQNHLSLWWSFFDHGIYASTMYSSVEPCFPCPFP